MRRVVCVFTIAAVIAAGMPYSPVNAQTAVVAARVPDEGANSIRSIINAHPNGGAQMAEQIADLITRDPNLAKDLVLYFNNTRVNDRQRKAAQQGLAEAMTRLKATNQYRDDDNPLVITILMAAFTLLGFVGFIDQDADQKRSSSPE